MITSRDDLQDILSHLNNSGLAQSLSQLNNALLLHALNKIAPAKVEYTRQQEDKLLLNHVGPAAACEAVNYTINHLRSQGHYQNLQFTSNFVQNVELVQNDPVGDYPSFSNTMRLFLQPRYAFFDFDQIVDPRHMVDYECGYPRYMTPIMYKYLYDRDSMGNKVVNIYPDESWAMEPEVYESEDEETWTPFEKAWKELCETHLIMQYLWRMDRMAGIGHYGTLLIGIDDGKELDQPVEGIDEFSTPAGISLKGISAQNTFSSNEIGNPPEEQLRTASYRAGKGSKYGKHQLLYLRPFDEYLSFIQQYEMDQNSPRYGMPKMYTLVFLDLTIDAAGAAVGTRLNRRVHWTRVLHVADNLCSSLVFGIPRMQPVFNDILALRKVRGGSAEMFWKGAFPGISFEVDPGIIADQPEFDRDAFRKEVLEYSEGLRRYLLTVGIKANSLAPQIASPKEEAKMLVEMIASNQNIPYRIFMGSEEARLASSEDKLTWNRRLGRRLKTFVEPWIVRNFINRLIQMGILPAPTSGTFQVGWGDLNTTTDEDKANLALKWSQAMSQYVSSGMVHLINPVDYFTIILGLNPRDAIRIAKGMNMEMLKKVDPSQGSGVNGKRENNVTEGEGNTTRGERPQKRETSDKKAEGMKS